MKATNLLIVLLTAAASSIAASPLAFGPPARLSPFRIASPGDDTAVRLEARANGFEAYWNHGTDLRSEAITGLPPRPDDGTNRAIANAGKVAEIGGTPIIASTEADGTILVTVSNPLVPPASVVVGHGTLGGIECNATHCVVEYNNPGSHYAVIDGNLNVHRIDRPQMRSFAWAADPNGFLAYEQPIGGKDRIVRIDNGGTVTADVILTQVADSAAVVFNGDRYAVFTTTSTLSANPVFPTGSTLSAMSVNVDGAVSAATAIAPVTRTSVAQAAWNGSQYLLVLIARVGDAFVPEFAPDDALTGLLVGSSLSAINPPPFAITETSGAHVPVNVVWNGSVFYVLWTHFPHGSALVTVPLPSTVDGAAIAANGGVLTRDLVSHGPIPQNAPHVAQGTSKSVVLWHEQDLEANLQSVRYAVTTRGGVSIREAELDRGSDLSPLDIAALGDDFLAVWRNGDSVHGAIIHADGSRQDIDLPSTWTLANVAANDQHWVAAGSRNSRVETVAVERNGSVSAPTTIQPFPYAVSGIASDGNGFLLTARGVYLLNRDGSLLTQGSAPADEQADFAGGVYGTIALGIPSKLNRYDSNGNFIGSTVFAPGGASNPTLTHIGPLFVITDDHLGHGTTVSVIAADGTPIALGEAAPDVVIARTSSPTSTAVETRLATVGSYPMSKALYVESVSVGTFVRRRGVVH